MISWQPTGEIMRDKILDSMKYRVLRKLPGIVEYGEDYSQQWPLRGGNFHPGSAGRIRINSSPW